MRTWWRSITAAPASVADTVEEVRRIERSYAALDDGQLGEAARNAVTLPQVVAVTTLLASRVLGFGLFDVQLHAALALTDGKIVEMQTGEGKTVAAVPAIAWFARAGQGVHVLTANDYLARRDARWMGGIYDRLGLSVGVIQQHMTSAERRAAYACDVTYATANEVGFDYLRDQLALHPEEQVLRPFAVAVCDEADSALIDEARIPLVIAGGAADVSDLPARADRVVRRLMPWDRSIDEAGRNVALTPSGLVAVERGLGCDLYAIDAAPMMAAVHEALHAHTLLHRDIDYVVHSGEVLSVDEFKGRIVRERRWPGGLQTALEWKEGVPSKIQGRVLGSITVENLIALYPAVCGMSGTAVTQARCVVNGCPGEARDADLGIAAGNKRGHLFVKGQNVAVVPEDEMVDQLVEWAEFIQEHGVDAALARVDLVKAAREAEKDRARLLDEQGADANQAAEKIVEIRKTTR